MLGTQECQFQMIDLGSILEDLGLDQTELSPRH